MNEARELARLAKEVAGITVRPVSDEWMQEERDIKEIHSSIIEMRSKMGLIERRLKRGNVVVEGHEQSIGRLRNLVDGLRRDIKAIDGLLS